MHSPTGFSSSSQNQPLDDTHALPIVLRRSKRTAACISTILTSDVVKASKSLKNEGSTTCVGPIASTSKLIRCLSATHTDSESKTKANVSFHTQAKLPVDLDSSSLPIKPISATASLVSRERFHVDLPDLLDQPLYMEIFKSIPGSFYDASILRWSVPLTHYAKMMTMLDNLKPYVVIGGLPPLVLKLFGIISSKCQSQKDVDLSPIDPFLVNALMPFQKDGVVFGIQKNGRVLIADDMGLGKTIQALGIAHYYFEEWPLLIVAPFSMRYRWRESIKDWLPSISTSSIFIMESAKDNFSTGRVVIISFELLQTRCEDITGFKVVIIDESHNLKNHKSALCKAARPILCASKRVIMLSGTPDLSHPIELFPQISALNKTMFTHKHFGVRYCAGHKNRLGWDYSGSSHSVELNLILQKTIMIRRMKSQVLSQLPSKLRKVRRIESGLLQPIPGLNAREAFTQSVKENVAPSEVRRRLLNFYVESARQKVPVVGAYVRELLDSNRKFIVFAYHNTMVEGISRQLERAKVKYIRIDYNTSLEDCLYCVQQFQGVYDIRVAVLSMLANSLVGITLGAAHLVIFAEPHWNSEVLMRAEDIADTLVVEYLLTRGTSDDIFWPMVQDNLNVPNQNVPNNDNLNNGQEYGHVVQTAKDVMMMHCSISPTTSCAIRGNSQEI